MNHRWIACMLALAVLTGLTGIASAETVTAKFSSVAPSRTLYYSFNGNATNTVAGLFNWTNVSGALTEPFSSFCIELDEHISYSHTYTFDVTQPADAPTLDAGRADALSELWGVFHGDLADGDAAQQRNNAAAFQIAVWEIVHDDDRNVLNDNGVFHARGSSTSAAWTLQAQAMLDWIGMYEGDRANNLAALVTPRYQDQLAVIHAPAPAAVWGGIGLLTFAGMIRRRMRCG